MAKILVLQHHPVETIGRIADSLRAAAHAWQFVRSFQGDAVPSDMKGASGLIVMGGPMGVYEQERFPFLRDELRLIERALADKRPVLGVCLGSQLLAAALGAKVYKGSAKEIGWHDVRLTPVATNDPLMRGLPQVFTPLHWHGDVFDLPSGATHLASSAMTPIQAFRHDDNAYGLLFHMEATRETVEAFASEFRGEIVEAGVDAAAILSNLDNRLSALDRIAETVFTRWAESIPMA
jgi:GMP synthase (glutamine-hydrolysing)